MRNLEKYFSYWTRRHAITTAHVTLAITTTHSYAVEEVIILKIINIWKFLEP